MVAITTTARRICRDVNAYASTGQPTVYFDGDGRWVGSNLATAPTVWVYAVQAGERITQQTAQHIVNAVTDTEADLEAWFDKHERVLRFIPDEVDRRRAHQ